MAKLNSELTEFAAATTAVAITTGRKLARNFAYYRSGRLPATVVTREELQILCGKLRMELFGLHNLMEYSEKRSSPVLVAIAGEINDLLEEIHRKLLFFPADYIDELISDVDKFRNYWRQFTEEHFYSEALNRDLEIAIPNHLLIIENKISELPKQATI